MDYIAIIVQSSGYIKSDLYLTCLDRPLSSDLWWHLLLSSRIDGRIFEYIDYIMPARGSILVMVFQGVGTHYILIQDHTILKDVTPSYLVFRRLPTYPGVSLICYVSKVMFYITSTQDN